MPTWTKEEDEVLTTAVRLYGVKAWSIVACALRGRTGKQCRERYQHQLLHNKQPKTSAALQATERRFSVAHHGAASRQAFSMSGKTQLQVDTSCLLAEDSERTPDDDFSDELQVSIFPSPRHVSCVYYCGRLWCHCLSAFCRSKHLESGCGTLFTSRTRSCSIATITGRHGQRHPVHLTRPQVHPIHQSSSSQHLGCRAWTSRRKSSSEAPQARYS